LDDDASVEGEAIVDTTGENSGIEFNYEPEVEETAVEDVAAEDVAVEPAVEAAE
jgi:hypothetical protein